MTATAPPPTVTFNYLKSNHFRVIHVDGMLSGITPSLMVSLAVFNERAPIPQQVTQTINPNGTLGDAVEGMTVTRGGIVREVEADLLLSLEAAIGLRTLLDQQIANLLAAREAQAQANAVLPTH